CSRILHYLVAPIARYAPAWPPPRSAPDPTALARAGPVPPSVEGRPAAGPAARVPPDPTAPDGNRPEPARGSCVRPWPGLPAGAARHQVPAGARTQADDRTPGYNAGLGAPAHAEAGWQSRHGPARHGFASIAVSRTQTAQPDFQAAALRHVR